MSKKFKIILNDRAESGNIYIELVNSRVEGFKYLVKNIVTLNENNKKINYDYELIEYPDDYVFREEDVEILQNSLNEAFKEVINVNSE